MAKLIVNRDYNSKKNKGNVVGYKISLSKAGVKDIAHIDENDELNIDYFENKIVITKK